MTTSVLRRNFQAKKSLPAIVLVFGFLTSFSCAQFNVSFTGNNGKDHCQICCHMPAEERLLKSSVSQRRTEDAHASTGDSHDTHASTNGHSSTHDNSHGTHASAGHDSVSNSHSSGGHASGGHASGGHAAGGHASGSHASGSHASGGHHQWWTHEYEYIHFENMVLVALVIVTLVFDEIHHRSEHMAARMGSHGLLSHYLSHDEILHIHIPRSLWEQYSFRFNGELTVLGFLSLVVWSTNQAGFFEDLANIHWPYEDEVALPKTAEDYLHTVEEVHIFLFVTMCCYFYYIGIIVYVATWLVHSAVEVNWEIEQAYKNGEIVDGNENAYYSSKPPSFRSFFILRQYFFESLNQWRATWPFLDEHLSFFREQLVTNAKFLDKNIDAQQSDMALLMKKWFPFDLYYALNFRHSINELIEISWVTWAIIMLILFASALVHAKFQIEIDVPVIALICSQSLIVVMGCVTMLLYKNAKSHVKRMWAGNLAPLNWVHRFHPQRWMLRMFQVCVFMTLYKLASTIACKRDWKEHTGRCIAYLCFVLLALIPEGFLMGQLLPLYSILISIGPYMQEKHVARLAAIVNRYNAQDFVHLRQLAENIGEFDEEAECIELERQESQRTAALELELEAQRILNEIAAEGPSGEPPPRTSDAEWLYLRGSWRHRKNLAVV